MPLQIQSMYNGHLGRNNDAKCRVKLLLRDKAPGHSAPFRAVSKIGDFEIAEICKIYAKNIIENSQTERAAPIVFLSRKDKNLHHYVNYRKWEVVSKKSFVTHILYWWIFGSLGKETNFSTLNANSGDLQIRIEDIDNDKTAFKSHHGLYRLFGMHFG